MSKVWVTDGKSVHRINEEDFSLYESQGFRRGKKRDNEVITAWNKGLTSADPRVKSYVDNKPKQYRKRSIHKECSSCGKTTSINHIYCPHCGKVL